MTSPESRSMIRTECAVPNATILRWLLSMFPEIHEDAKIDTVVDTYRGSIKFTVLHTQQPSKPAGPIMLSPPGEDVADAEVE